MELLKKITIPLIVLLFFITIISVIAGSTFIPIVATLAQLGGVVWIHKEGSDEFVEGSQKLWKDLKSIF